MSRTLTGFLNNFKENTVFQVMAAVELLLAALLLVNCLRSRCDYVFDADRLNSSGEYVQYLTGDQGELVGYSAYLDENIAETTLVYTENFKLYPGAYRIAINYFSQVNYGEAVSNSNGNGFFYLDSEKNSVYFSFASIFLRNGVDMAEQTVQIRSPWAIDDLSLRVTYYGMGELTVYSIEVTEITAYRYICFLTLLFFFFCLDFVCYLLFVDRNFPYTKELGVLLMICAAAFLPFASDYTFVGHDTGFHINRIRSLAWELANGNYFPAINSYSANGYGYAVPLFYCPFFLYFPAILYNCGFSLTFVFNFYLCVMSVATCLIMYYCSCKIIHNRNSSLMAAAMYTFGGPRLTAVFTRSAVGEITAQTFFPLIVLGFYSVYSAPKGEKVTIRRYWPIIVGLTGVVASHALSTVMCAMVIVAVCVVLWKKTMERQRFAGLAKAAALTLLVNLAVLIPMLDSMQMDLVLTNGMGAFIQTNGAYLIQIVNSIMNNYDLSSQAGTASGDMSFSLGFATCMGLLLFPLCRIKERKEEALAGKMYGFTHLCWCFSLVMIFLSTIYMFYDYLSFLPAPVYSALTTYQFPWRWLSYASLFGVFCTASALEQAENRSVFGRVPVTVLLCTALIVNTGQVYSDALREMNLSRYSDSNSMDIGGGGEYLLLLTDLTQLSCHDLFYDEEQLSIGEYRSEGDRWRLYDVDNSLQEETTVDIPVFCYDHYAAYDVDTGEKIDITTGENNRIRLTVPADYSGTIEVKYEVPLMWKLAILISTVTDLALFGYGVVSRKKQELNSNS